MQEPATERKHHHHSSRPMLETDHLDIGTCDVCGRHLFVSTDEGKTIYEVATEREEELILALVNARAQIARMRNE